MELGTSHRVSSLPGSQGRPTPNASQLILEQSLVISFLVQSLVNILAPQKHITGNHQHFRSYRDRVLRPRHLRIQEFRRTVHVSLHIRSELLSTDWNQEWMRLQAGRRRADDSFEWDKRARHFRPLETASYARDFMKLLALEPGESVLDMGCGAGSIAIPLAQAGHPVIAADFSPAMLGTLDAGIEYYGLEDRITPLELAWDDDWDLVGPVAKAVDVAFASRSVTTTNLKGVLAKLDRTARRRCAVTMVANSSPRYDLHLMNAIGASVTCSNGFVYAFNILIQMGALPQVTYFESPRRDTFDSLEAGVADFSRMLERGNEDKIDRLRDYIAQHMIENPHAGEPGSKGVPQGRYMLDHVRKVRWAFIAWEPVSSDRP